VQQRSEVNHAESTIKRQRHTDRQTETQLHVLRSVHQVLTPICRDGHYKKIDSMLKEWIVFYCCISRKTNQTFSHKKSTLKRQNLKIKTKSHIFFMDDQRWYIIVSYSEIIDLTLLVLYTYRRDKSDSDTSLNSGDAMS